MRHDHHSGPGWFAHAERVSAWLSRCFLALLLTVTGALLGCTSVAGQGVRGTTERVVVVGAGVSGLTAAHALHASGVEVVVLEARDRVGGRTHTADIDGTPIDLGGAWVHGQRGNPVRTMAKALGIPSTPHDYDPTFIVDSEVGRLSDSQLEFMGEVLDESASALPRIGRKLGGNASVTDAMDAWIAAEGATGRDARWARFVVEQGIVELDYSGPADKTSIRWLGAEEGFAGGDALLEGGYATLVTHLAEGLDIRTSQPVTKIRYADDGVVVTTATGESFDASHVVVTVPLGVLKSEAITFDPPLPADKRAAIERLDMGNLEKVVLRFDEVFWQEFAGTTGVYLDAKEPGRYPSFVDLTPFTGKPTLVCIYGGAFSRKTQRTSTDAQIVAGSLEALEKVVGRTPPTPVATAVTHWTTDPFAGGSYAYIAAGASPEDMRKLAEPVAGRVLFAGEATLFEYHGTVHGALLSGLREAERLGAKRSGLPGL